MVSLGLNLPSFESNEQRPTPMAMLDHFWTSIRLQYAITLVKQLYVGSSLKHTDWQTGL